MGSHVVIFPFMAQGHTLPLLDLSRALSNQKIKVTIFTTPSNAKSITTYFNSNHNINDQENLKLISVMELPFSSSEYGLPQGIENTSQLPSMDLHLNFVQATKQLQKPFNQALQSILESETRPLCVVSDFFLGWTLETCQEFGIPRLVFHGMSVLSMAICKSVIVHQPQLKVSSVVDPVELPGINLPFTLTTLDLPVDIITTAGPNDPMTLLLNEVGGADANSWGILVNSFQELERSHVPSFEAFYFNGAKAWCLGPLFLYNEGNDNNTTTTNNSIGYDNTINEWLDEQLPGSVIYVSFGTQAEVCDSQLDEVASGLKQSGFSFIWVVRSKTWSLSADVEEQIKGRGIITRDWVDQRQILSHKAVGGFISHCGWNSVLESLSAGVPILAWPMIAEQGLNAKFVVEGLGAGLSINNSKNEKNLVSSRELCDGVRELMGGVGVKGSIARERAQALGRIARNAIKEGGSSYCALNDLIEQLRAYSYGT